MPVQAVVLLLNTEKAANKWHVGIVKQNSVLSACVRKTKEAGHVVRLMMFVFLLLVRQKYQGAT